VPGLFFEDLAIGRSAERSRVVTGDENLIHLDEGQ
jgi:acyl dehydratase